MSLMPEKLPTEKIQTIIEAALMVAGQPLTVSGMQNLFPEADQPSTAEIKAILSHIQNKYTESGIELREVASGYRFQAKAELSPWLSRLWEERAPRYSRAFLETLAIIAYKQPITRAEIEEIRGVTVSSNIIKTLMEREWIKIIGHREVPGRPAIFGTSKAFLDYFNLKSLTDLPSLAEFKDLQAQEAQLQVQLAIENSNIAPQDSEVIPEERDAIIREDADTNNIIPINESIDTEAKTQNSNSLEITDMEAEENTAEEIANHHAESVTTG
jgi:segregation and condensation protein B